MKKNNEGYALPLVLVVMVVLSLVAITAMAGPLRNLQTQQASLKRMQDRYAAEGRIEMVVAQLCNVDGMKDFESTETDAKAVIEDKIKSCGVTVSDTEPDPFTYEQTEITVKETPTDFDCTFTLTVDSGSATISCELKLSGTIRSNAPEEPSGKTTYTIESPTITYNSYEITYGGGA